jgi:hypothetical protein
MTGTGNGEARMPITGHGWEFQVQRLGHHRLGNDVRSYGSYQVHIDGSPVPPQNNVPLGGFVCEAPGPGQNHPAHDHHPRVEPGRYPLTTQFGKYVSIGYSPDTHIAGQPHMPGVAFDRQFTGARTGILIHPGHPADVGDPPFTFLASIGCFNLTKALQPAEDMEFFDSRARVIALINSLAAFFPAAFRDAQGDPILNNTPIQGAFAVVDGDSTTILVADPVVVASGG